LADEVPALLRHYLKAGAGVACVFEGVDVRPSRAEAFAQLGVWVSDCERTGEPFPMQLRDSSGRAKGSWPCAVAIAFPNASASPGAHARSRASMMRQTGAFTSLSRICTKLAISRFPQTSGCVRRGVHILREGH
jgi:hypothetical protein